MSYYLEPHSNIRAKAKVVSDFLNYANKNKLNHATGVHTFDLAA